MKAIIHCGRSLASELKMKKRDDRLAGNTNLQFKGLHMQIDVKRQLTNQSLRILFR